MVSIPNRDAATSNRPIFYKRIGRLIANQMPKGLYARALIIIIAPMVVLQSVVAFVFMERHWQTVTRRLSEKTVSDIALLISVYKAYPHNDKYEKLIRMAQKDVGLAIQILPEEDLPPAAPKPFFALLDRSLSNEMRRQIGLPFWIDTVGRSHLVEIRIRLEKAVLKVIARRSQTYASNSHIFLVWMVGISLVLITVAVLFLRNQIKPILRLSQAAELFGKGRPAPDDFRPRGAREVRQAARAFIEMRDRIERQMEQRTTMLAGVSHDLRTILTRFRLQLAMAGESESVKDMRIDVDEMQAMLEDYMSFAKGDSSEETSRVNIRQLLRETRKQASRNGKNVTLKVPDETIIVSLRRHTFKRAIDNIVSNAIRFAENVSIEAIRTKRFLTIRIEDDGPGIPEVQREEVFRPFYRLDDARHQDTGTNTGLGLSIARDIIRSHGGDIKLDKSRMGGLKATIRVPV